MAAFGFSSTAANIKIAGISSWELISAGDASGHINLGSLADGKVVIQTLTRTNSKGQPVPYAADVSISAKMLATHKTTVLELLGSLYGPANHEILFVNGLYLLGSTAATDKLGLGWKFDSSSDYDGMRFIEVTAKGKLILSGTDFDLDDLFGASTGITADPAASGLTAWSAVGYNPAGMTAFETRNAGETNWETLGNFRAGKVTMETLEYTDNHGRNIPYAVKFSAEAEMMQTSITELELLDALAAGTPDFRATLADGCMVTLADNCGVHWEYHNENDSDGPAVTRVVGSGIVQLSDVAGIFS